MSLLQARKCQNNMSYRTRQCKKTPVEKMKHDFFKNTFFPSTVIEWNELDWNIQNSESVETFLKNVCHLLDHLLTLYLIAITLKG